MANFIYDKAAESLWKGEIDWLGGDIKIVLVDGADYVPAKTSDQFLADIASGARVSTSASLTNKTVIGRVIDADDVILAAVAGDESEIVVIYQDTGDEATSRLIAHIDSATGLPITPNSADITIKWNANGIATL